MQLSVVIPFYQVEKYIGACLAALAGLPAEESEILLVDDCGRDGSAAIAAAYCAAHPNARVIRRAQNGGLSAARNTGLDAARGEYVYFLDSDDVPRAEALWRLTQAARERRLDIAKARFCFLNDETGELTDGAAIRPTDVLEGGALLAAQCQSGTYEPMVWQCVYRRAFLLENGLRIGLVGVCTHFVRRWATPMTVEKLVIEEPIPAAKAALDAVKPLCDVTVLIYHGGFECDLETGEPLTDSAENQACRLCRELDFDLVLTGHQHMRVDGVRFCNSFAVQPTYRAPHCCGITVTVEDDGSKRFESRIIPAEGKPLARAYDLLLPLEKRVQTWLDTPAGHLDLPLVAEDHLKAALNGSNLANFINTVQLEASGAQIASSALPNEFKGLPTEVTIRDVVSTYIYTNTLVVLEMTRPALKQYIERSAAYFDHDEDGNLCIADEFLRPKVQHYNYDFFSGIHYTIDARNPVGQRVTSIVLDGRELGEDEPVTVCVNSYRFCGTGGYDMLPRQKVAREVLTDVADAMIDYITSHPNIRVDTEKYCTVIG